MAHCVVSHVPAPDGGHQALCAVHCHRAPCPHHGAPANLAPIHAGDSEGRVRVVAEWASRTDRQRGLVLHRGSLRVGVHAVSGGVCWCGPETIPAAT